MQFWQLCSWQYTEHWRKGNTHTISGFHYPRGAKASETYFKTTPHSCTKMENEVYTRTSLYVKLQHTMETGGHVGAVSRLWSRQHRNFSFLFSLVSKPTLGFTEPPSMDTGVLSQGIKWLEHAANPSSPSSARDSNEQSSISTPLYALTLWRRNSL